MKKIEAIIRPTKLEDVKVALDELGVTGITVTHVMGSGKQRGKTAHYRGQEYIVNLLDKIKIEIIIDDAVVNKAMNIIADAAGTGEIGDGKIFVYKIDNAMRIRTKETGDIALH